MRKAIMPIRKTRINANTINMIIMTTGLSLSPPQSAPQSRRWHPPTQQTVVGGKQSQLQSQLPPAGPGVGT